jgi:ATP-binding cassette subfamily F protein uup
VAGAAGTRDASTIPGSAKARRLSFKDQRELEMLPNRIQALEQEQSELHLAIGDPELFRQSPERAAATVKRLDSLAKELEAAYARWDALESARPA